MYQDTTLTEVELVSRAKRGDTAAFGALAGRYEARVNAIARSICADPQRAEDAAQEAFVGAWRGLSGFDADKPFAPWLYAITRNAIRRTFRRREGEPVDTTPLEELGLAAGWGQSPERLAATHERLETLSACLARLSDGDRQVIWLRDVEGLTGPEAAAALGQPLAAMKTRLHRARLRLMEQLRGGEND